MEVFTIFLYRSFLSVKKIDKKFLLSFVFIAAVKIAIEANKESGPTLREFKETLTKEKYATQIANLKEAVEKFALNFPIPGHDDM